MKKIPLVHITDLYHPPQDPDDHFDLATVYGLPEIELKAVILDATRKFLHPAPVGYDIARDPGFLPVVQMNYMTGRTVPVVCGPVEPLHDKMDSIKDRSIQEQAAVEMLLALLRSSDEKMVISTVGSARVIAAAINRDRDLVVGKTDFVVLNAGSLSNHMEWNVKLDTAAFIRLWESGIPIHWYPCASERDGFDIDHRHTTFWYARHDELLSDISPMLKAWFAHAFTGNIRGDILHILDGHKHSALWEHVLSAQRNLWSTASLIMTAGRTAACTEQGWRFIPLTECYGYKTLDLKLIPIRAQINKEGHISWRITERPGKYFIFSREGGAVYREAMTEALRSLLRSL